ncbi:MAG: hypothetical protein ACPGO3_03245 [Magnetospiraceae bacterium]
MRQAMETDSTEKKHWLVRPESIKLMWRYGIGLLVVLTLFDLFMHGHPHFGIDGTFGFYSWYGFVTCAAMVIFAKGIGKFLKRKDSYYDD